MKLGEAMLGTTAAGVVGKAELKKKLKRKLSGLNIDVADNGGFSLNAHFRNVPERKGEISFSEPEKSVFETREALFEHLNGLLKGDD